MSAPDPIRRLREIAAEAADHVLLADGPVTPDAELLDLCAETLHLFSKARTLKAERDLVPAPWLTGRLNRKAKAEHERLFAGEENLVGQATALMRRIAKMPAKTPAGIYAKALIVKGSKGGAAGLAKTLAEDLIACRELRESLWPAENEGGAT